MEQSKRSSLSVARSILNHKVIGKKLESYLKVRMAERRYVIIYKAEVLLMIYANCVVVVS